MPSVGVGESRWFVRVEQFVMGDSARLVGPAARKLNELLVDDSDSPRGGADQGTGMASPVVGLTFIVRADGPGEAATLAVQIARRALGEEERGLYGVTVIAEQSAPEERPDGFPILDD